MIAKAAPSGSSTTAKRPGAVTTATIDGKGTYKVSDPTQTSFFIAYNGETITDFNDGTGARFPGKYTGTYQFNVLGPNAFTDQATTMRRQNW